MKITTEDCEKAIVKYIQENVGCVCSQFVGEANDLDFEIQAKIVSNWKRESKETSQLGDYSGYRAGAIVREFDCRPYDDQLRATVVERDGEIIFVEIRGE